MSRRFLFSAILFLLVPTIAFSQFVRPKILRGGEAFGAATGDPWKATWIGTGGKATVEGLDDQAIPVSKEDKGLDLKTLDAPAVVFLNPIGAKKGSLQMKYSPNGDWISFCVAPSDPWAWSQVDISKCDSLMVSVKGATGTETWSFKMKSGDLEGKDLKLVDYLPAKKITTEWQEAVIPLKDLIDTTKADLTKFTSLCGGINGEGTCSLWIDNLVFFKTKSSESTDAAGQAAPQGQ